MNLVRWLMASPLKGASKLYLGGDNVYGQIGDGTFVYKSSPVLAGTSYWSAVAEGTSHIVAIRSDGALFAWGSNDFGQVGNGLAFSRVSSPVQIGTSSWVSVAASNSNSYAIRKDGGLFAWGDNTAGQIGNNTTIDGTVAGYSYTSVGAGYFTRFALRSNSAPVIFGAQAVPTVNNVSVYSYIWPRNIRNPIQYSNESYKQFYVSEQSSIYQDVLATFNVTFERNTAYIRSDGALFTKGRNSYGELGTNSTVDSFSFVQVGTSSWTQVCVEGPNGAAIRSDGALFTWGINSRGLLGQNLFPGDSHCSSPVQVGTSSWSQVAMRKGGYQDQIWAAAIRADGGLFVWGDGYNGYLGNNNATTSINISWSQLGKGTPINALISTDNKLYTGFSSYTGDGYFGIVQGVNPPYYLQKIGNQSWTQVATGNNVKLAIRSDGALFGWGDNTRGLVGTNYGYYFSPVQIGTSSWSQVYLNPNASMAVAIRADGALFTWGSDSVGYGVLGNNSVAPVFSPVQIGTSSWSQVNLTSLFNLAIRSDGALFTWGYNIFGQLGDGTTLSRSSPVQIGTSSWTQLGNGPGNNLSYAIRSDGALFAWGQNTVGQLGDGTTINKSSPVQIGTSSWTLIRTGWSLGGAGSYAVAIRSDGRLFSWGDNTAGQLGDGTTVNKSSPVQIGTSSWAQVTTARNTTAALRTDSALFTWGFNGSGQIGDGTTINKSSPVQIGSSSWIQIDTFPSNATFYGLRSDRLLFYWGGLITDMVGPASLSSPVQIQSTVLSSPVQIGTSSWSQITLNSIVALAIRADGALFAWGNNYAGQVGDNSTISRSSPVQIGSSSWTKVGGNESISAAIRLDGALFTWGDGSLGLLGSGATTNRSSPAQVGTSSWTAITAENSTYNAIAIRSDGALFGWGAAGSFLSGEGVGDGTTILRSSPVQIGFNTFVQSPVQIGTSSWTAVTAGKSYASAIRTDGGLFAWGLNNTYQLGDGTTINRSSPVQIGTSSWALVNAGDRATLGITSNRRLFGWGNNENFATGVSDFVSPVSVGPGWNSTAIVSRNGRLYAWGNNGAIGDGTTISKSWPVQIGTSSWSQVDSSATHTVAINSIGQLYAWGLNTSGQLGDNTSINRSSPVLISTSSWTQVRAGFSHTMALRADGALFAWGSNSNAQLGLNINSFTANFSSPVQVGTSSWIQIATNNLTTHAIRSDGGLFGWGDNSAGQIGNNAVNVDGTVSWTQVANGFASATQFRTFGIRSDGALLAWGAGNNYGELGIGVFGFRSSPVQLGTSSWSQVAAGQFHALAIRTDGALFAWGRNDNGGGLGDNTILSKSSPVQIGTSSWSKVGAGADHSVAIRSDGALFAWGYNAYGAAGDGSTLNRSSPVQLGSSSWTAVAAGNNNAAAIRSDGRLFTWGKGDYGVLGESVYPYVNRSSPVQVGTSSWTQVGQGTAHTIAIRSDGGLFAWGSNFYGELGQNNVRITNVAQSWSTVGTFSSSHGGSIRNDGALFVFGNNNLGQLGQNSIVASYSPVQVGTSSWSQITAGIAASTYAIRSDGALFAWGLNTFGTIGDGTTITRSSPVQIGTSSWTQVAASQNIGFPDIAVAIRSDGALFAWGNNTANYYIGDNTTISRSSPVLIGGANSFTQATVSAAGRSYAIRNDGSLFTWGAYGASGPGNDTFFAGDNISWTQISAGLSYTAAIDSLGRLYTWGLNSSGQLGDSTTVNKSSPVQIGTSSWTQVNLLGTSTIAAIRSDGGLFTWGGNSIGQLGAGTTVNRSSPVQVGTSSWTQVRGGGGQTVLALRSDGGLFTWGANNYGQLGAGTTVNRSSPVQVGTSSWSQISAGRGVHAAAIRTDGALFTWGYNIGGQLGDSTTVDKSSPVQIGTSSWTQVSVDVYTAAIRSDGGLFTWGDGTAATVTIGILGTGAFVARSSPVQVGTSSWSQVRAGYNSYAIRSDGALFGWGYNASVTGIGYERYVGTLGINNTNYNNYIQSWTQVSSGTNQSSNFHILSLRADGGLFLQGINSTVGAAAYYPVQIGTSSWTQITAARDICGAIRSDGALFIWGDNQFGALGDGTIISKSSPVQIGTSSWTQIAFAGFGATNLVTAAIRSDGALFTWGSNFSSSGALGNNATASRSSPVQIGTSSWTQISGQNATFFTIDSEAGFTAIRSDGALFAWGKNNRGQLGDGTTVNKSSPVQIGTSSWTFVNGRAAIRSDGSLFMWGANNIGQLGDNTTVDKSSPVQIGTSSWTFVTPTAYSNNYAIRSDGALFGWGYNTVGSNITFNVGNGSRYDVSSPVQIGIGSSWTFAHNYPQFLAVGSEIPGAIAIRSDKTLFGWGADWNQNSMLPGSRTLWNYGLPLVSATGPWPYNRSVVVAGDIQPGNWPSVPTAIGYYPFYSSPVQIGTDSWTQISTFTSTTYGIRNSKLYHWGYGGTGYLIGDGTTAPRSSPVQIGLDKVYRTPTQITNISWSQIHAGLEANLGVSTDNKLYTWRSGSSGELGSSNTSEVVLSPRDLHARSWKWLGNTLDVTQGAIRSDGALFTWGQGINGPLGNNTQNSTSSPIQIGTSSWIMVDFDGSRSANAIRDFDYAVFGWGYNFYGQVGDNTTIQRSSPVQIGALKAEKITHGLASTFAIEKWSNALVAWGSNGGGLGDGTTINRSAPVYIGTSKWQNVNAYLATYAIREDGALFAWGGGNPYVSAGLYATGNNSEPARSSPVQIGTSSWTQVSTNLYNTLAIRSDGALFGWGMFNAGQLGTNESWNDRKNYAKSWAQVAFGFSHAVGVRSDGLLFTWGYDINGSGVHGDNTVTNKYYSPVQIGTSSWTKVGAGEYQSFAIRTDGALFAWGNNGSGALGDNTVINRSSPVQIGTSSWTQVDGPAGTTVAIRTDGGLFTWGSGTNGALGSNATTTRSSPVQVGTSSWTQIRGGNTTVFAIRSGGSLFAWGYNQLGWLGDGTTINKSSPVQIGTSSWTFISTRHAIRSDGALFAWGSNSLGQLGDGTTVDKSSPVQIGTSSWTQVRSGNTSYGIRSDGALFAWGSGANYNIGDNTTVSKSSPVQIGSSSWSQLGTSYKDNSNEITGAAIRTDGGLFTWGREAGGATLGDLNYVQLGYRSIYGNTLDTGYNSSPVQVGLISCYFSPVQIGTSSWSQVLAGTAAGAAIRIDGALFTWGSNYGAAAEGGGQLGYNTTINSSSPIQVGTSSWTQVQGLNDYGGFAVVQTFARRSDGTLWSWGAGNRVLGQTDQISRSSPVQIGNNGPWSTTSKTASLNYTNAAAIRTDGALFTWGGNTFGELATGAGGARSSAVQVGTSSWSQVTTGLYSSAFLRTDNLLYWAGVNIVEGSTNSANTTFQQPNNIPGSGSNSPVLLGSLYSTSSPVQIGTSSWTQIATGALFNHNRAIRSGGSLFAWGRNNSPAGVIGDSTTTDKSSPVQIGTSSWIQVSSAHEIRSDYVLFGQSENAQGATGDGTVVTKSSPVQLGSYPTVKSPTQIGTSSWTQVYAGWTHTVALRSGGSLFTWGSNSGGQLGDNTTINKSSPVQIGSSSWSMLAASILNTYGITSANMLFGWGNNLLGALGLTGDGTAIARSSPVQIGANPWREVYGKGYTTFAIRNDGAMLVWGVNELNALGSFGNGTTTSRNSPVLTGSLITSPVLVDGNSWNFASAGYDNGLGVDINNKAYAWGYNRTNTYSWTTVSGAGSPIAAIRSDGMLFTWGAGTAGGLGDGTTVTKSSPVQIGTSSWSQVHAGVGFAHAIRADGALFGWGTGAYIGDGTTVAKSSPVQIGSSSWSMLQTFTGVGGGNIFAIRSNGSLFGWGDNSGGRIGDGTTIPRSSPVQIGTSSWTQVTSYTATKAIRIDGALFVWGTNTNGDIGDGTTFNRSSPVQIGTSSWTQVTGLHAIRSDGALFGWGNNQFGGIGDGTYTNRLSPVQIGTSSWTQVVSSDRYGAAAIRADGALFTWVGPRAYIGSNVWGWGIVSGASYTFNENGESIYNISPVQLGTGLSWTKIHVAAINYGGIVVRRDDNKIFMINTGRLGPAPNNTGEVFPLESANRLPAGGNNNNTYYTTLTEFPNIASYPSPTQIGVGGTWKKVSAGAAQNYLINNANVLYSWGSSLKNNYVINYDYALSAITADIDDAGANKDFNGVRGYIKK